MNTELVMLFQQTMPVENLDLIPLNFVCESFGINYERQYKNIDNDKSFDGVFFKVANERVFGDKRTRGHLNKKGFLKWIMQMNPSFISESLRDTFIEYQNNLVDYLYDNAIQQEGVLKQITALKNERNDLYEKLLVDAPDFRRYIDVQTEIMRLGKENKAIQTKIGGLAQVKFNFPED